MQLSWCETCSRPLVTDQEIKNPYWVSGFVTGEGCFHINTLKSRAEAGSGVNLNFYITQHLRDTELMESLVKYLNFCGVFFFICFRSKLR
jgi:hypothetical protein